MDKIARTQLTSINDAFQASNGDPKIFEKQIDRMIDSGDLLLPDSDGNLVVEKANKSKSKLDVRNTTLDYAQYAGVYSYMRNVADQSSIKDVPNFEDPYIDYYLADIWKTEPILAGAVYSMSAKMTAISWSVTGRRLAAKKTAQMLASAAHMGGNDWAGFISASSQDFYTTNRGVFWETPRNGHYSMGSLADLGHIDALSCSLTGNTKYPVWYQSELTGQQIKFRPGETIHFASMPSPRERFLGTGFCAVARSIRAAKLLIGLHDYDAEKLSNLPPEGVAAVTGLTVDEFQDALVMWEAERRKNNSLTFPQVLWLIGSQPNVKVGLDFVGFSQMPESFDRKIVVDQYVNLVALVFGVDAREFWPISTSTLGTAAESEIQHLKAKGKGSGEIISIVERHVNGELHDDVDFAFDTQDIEEDLKSAEIANAWISAYMPLLTGGQPPAPPAAGGQPPNGNGTAPPPAQPPAKGLLDEDQVMRLLVDKGVLPDYLLSDGKTAILDSDVHIAKQLDDYTDNFVKIVWSKEGILTMDRISLGEIYTNRNRGSEIKFIDNTQPLPVARLAEKSQDDAPNYRPVGKTAQKRCTNCKFSKGFHCEKFDFQFTTGHTCDAWESNGRFKESEEEDVRRIIGKPIPDTESLRGIKPTKKTIEEENELWRNTPGLDKHALSEDEASDYEV